MCVDWERRCSDGLNMTACHQLFTMARTFNNKLWSEYKKSQENITGADLYTTVILGLFASVIILLMVRSIKLTDSLDDQIKVTTLLSSMHLRVEQEEEIRHRRRKKELKRRAQIWLTDIKSKSLNGVARKCRSSSFYSLRSRDTSTCSMLTSNSNAFSMKPPAKAKSYTVFFRQSSLTTGCLTTCCPVQEHQMHVKNAYQRFLGSL
ncbi:hypothetical protein KIN20_031019 [Parelaphostrongylus tenuis]|uniref:Uncharacterized protein n=1 Tax=Parelaphostrongylus tenuis TaxID=148309 RepID=A0AAD5R4K0_PARTN|nr:hypothetical protein KIN20_031019 [Parelaphostrongylus tenuis]